MKTTLGVISKTLSKMMTLCLCVGMSLSITSVLASDASDKTTAITESIEAVMKSVLSEITEDQTAKTAEDARLFLATVRPDEDLQILMDGIIEKILSKDSRARKARTIGAALIDMKPGEAPRIAHWNGNTLIYPASVVKFVYLMAAYAWEEQGILKIDKYLDRQMTAMIYKSSNTATQNVFHALTGTDVGPRLKGAEYEEFKNRRLMVERWLETLGVTGIHSIHPTYNGGSDLYGRDVQLLEDGTVKGGISNAKNKYKNRQAMTAVGTVKLLSLLASDLSMSPERAAKVRHSMKRSLKKQPYLHKRIAGGGLSIKNTEVYSKTGTWGPIYADAGIVRHMSSGRQLVIAVYIDSKPAYRGRFIVELSKALTKKLLDSNSRK